MTETSTFLCKNIVYGTMCKRCNVIYIGETCRRLADRITEHIRSILQNSIVISPDASVVHASGSGQLKANPHVAGPWLSLGSPLEGW